MTGHMTGHITYILSPLHELRAVACQAEWLRWQMCMSKYQLSEVTYWFLPEHKFFSSIGHVVGWI